MRTRFIPVAFAAIAVIALAAIMSLTMTAFTQGRGGGRGAQPAPPQGAPAGAQPAPAQQGRGGGGGGGGRGNTPTFPGPPAGMQALPIDLYTSKNFYKDKALWADKRYFRCNTPRQITDIWTSHRIGDRPPASASWGDCNID